MPCAMAGLQDVSRQTTKFSWLLRTDHRSEKPGARDMNEVSLAIKTSEGVAVVVGCSHPGVEKSSRTRPQSILDSTPSPAALISGNAGGRRAAFRALGTSMLIVALADAVAKQGLRDELPVRAAMGSTRK